MSNKKNQIVSNNTFNEFLLYTTPNGKVKVEIFLHNENIWLTQEKIAQLFGAIEGKTRTNQVKFYNPDAIIRVGCRFFSFKEPA